MRLDVFRIRPGRFFPQNRMVLCFTVIALVLSCATVNKTYAQEGTVSQTQKLTVRGKVADETGKPLQGVSVTVKGSTKGVATNENGEFSIEIPGGAKILQFSYVGMEPQEVKIGSQKEFNVSLVPEMKDQQEVVVVGYGTQKKQAVTGAVVKADLKTYENVTVNNIMEVLKGTVAGLNVGEANTAGGVPGDPGACAPARRQPRRPDVAERTYQRIALASDDDKTGVGGEHTSALPP